MTDLEKAHERRLAGDLDTAETYCQKVLAGAPETAEALSLLAVCRAERGAVDAAQAPIEQARNLAPDSAIVAMHLSVVKEASGLIDEAMEAAREATSLGPDRFETWGRRGDLAGRLEQFEEAEDALAHCLELKPDHAGVALRLAGARLVLEDFAGASAALDQIGPQADDLPEALQIRVAISHRNGDWRRMQAYAERLLTLMPDDPDMTGALAYALGQQGYYNKASRIFRPVLDAEPDNARHWAALGRLRLGARSVDEARECFSKALEIEPDNPDANFGMARLLTFTGDMQDAEAYCRRTLEADPDHLEAFGQLCEVSSGRISDEELERLETLLEEDSRPADQQAIGLFALGDIYHARKRPDDAFDSWSRANEAKQSLISETRPGYDAQAQASGTQRLMSAFPAPVEPATAYDRKTMPLFIVGMPRSGTTLLETAISAHSEVSAAGELPAMPFIIQEMLAWMRKTGWKGGKLPAERLEAWRQTYIGQYDSFDIPPARFVTDKQPSNFLAVGLIAQLFPEAPIIHIRRNAVETGFSIFRRNFTAQWPFANDLEDIAHYYGQYAQIMRHWDRALPDRVNFVQYEDLIDSFEPELRRLLDGCGLDFEQQCVDYHTVDRTVMTFSATQVRKGPTASHKRGSAAYEHRLEPLRDGLRANGIVAETGALAGEGAGIEPVSARSSGDSARRPFWKRLLGS
ncbi:tetratricopeptide repeat-containing sulfotransferase family protein [Marinicauda sp. Alg238-R41]|uniref:tetratricopeptide repeat-containing sulfotransferase family protein n=1 Tax=Marinicauda sp. Alg238-R41 TaxID=2993447 RepID=UPI0022E6070A|nr:tetratricopeptide repeat-containing sulfotransferase family protein [Marinicauda sp. Alg238-R41]